MYPQKRRHYTGKSDYEFTDGSPTTQGVGAGIFGKSAKMEISITLGKYMMIFHAEMLAILECVHYV